MPAPIAISKTPSDCDSFGSPRNSSQGTPHGSLMNGLSTSLIGASSGSFREAIAASFGKEASENFKCCGQGLENLHDLLQHYEERHVKFEDDEMPAMVTDDGNSASSSSASSSQPPSPKTTNATNATKTEAKNDTFEESSAFDTTIMRSSPVKGGKKRSFGQFSNGNNNSSVHQSLRRALIDGGVGRGSSKASSIYSANSPFSTPGSSIPGTPTMDSDGDTAFFGNGNNVPAFSSLSIRGSGDDHDLPSCAPPNLFFPTSGSSSTATTSGTVAPPLKRERMSSVNSAVSSSALENSLASPGALGDRPYKCQSPGCDKAYKQMNGLKYHRLHGQCNQNTLPPQQQLSAVVNEKSASAATPGTSSAASPTTDTVVPTPATSAAVTTANNTAATATTKTTTAAAAASTPISAAVAAALEAVTKAANAKISTAPATVSPPSVPSLISTEKTSPDVIAGETVSPASSAPGSPQSSSESLGGEGSKFDRVYICQVGSCGKRYKNLNGLRYHYLHSGSHGLLGLQLLSSNGGGPSARADANTGRPAISTNDLSTAALAAAAQAAAAQQQANQRSAAMQQQEQQEQKQESS